MEEVEDFWNDYLIVIIGSVGMAIFNIITFTIIIRMFSPEQFGSYNLFMSIAQVGLFLGANWTVSAMIRFGKEEAIAQGTIRKTFWSRALMFGITLPIFLIFFYIFRYRISTYIGFSLSESISLPFYFIVLSVSSLLLFPYQAMGKMKTFSFMPVVEKMLFCVLLLLATKIVSRNISSLIWVLVLAGTLSNLILFLLLKKGWVLPVETSKEMIKKVFNFSWPALPGGMAGYIVNWVDVIVIKIYLDITLVGLYSVSYSIYNYLMALPLMGINLISLMLTAFLVRKREDLVLLYVKRFIPQAVFLWSFFVSFIMIMSGFLLELWAGPQYRAAVPSFILLAIGLVFRGITCAYTPIYTAYIMPKRYHTVNIFIAFFNLAGDFIFIPRYGIIGAAISTTLAFFISSIFLLVMANRKLKITLISPLLYTIPAIICGLISLLMNNFSIKLVFFILIFSITILIPRKNKLFRKEDTMVLEPIKMPAGFKKIITRIIHGLTF